MLELNIQLDGEKVALQFEHSLFAMSKWESKIKRPFLGKFAPDPMEMLFYYECMLLSPGVDPNVVYALAPDQMEALGNYINETRTASNVPNQNNKPSTEVVTSDLIYYWMTAMKINWEAQYWHLSRLMMLIQITNFKNQPEKNKKQQVDLNSWREANERQKALFKTKG